MSTAGGLGRRRSSSGEGGGHVLGRLHALFGPSSPTASTSSTTQDGSTLHNGHLSKQTEPVAGSAEVQGQQFVDRNGIKVFMATWNMGDSLPKGDLSVLLGHVPPYVASNPPIEGLPPLPLANVHPYHIVVIAGQECPTDSGVPRGLGGGIMKGMSIKRHLDSTSRKDKSKDPKDEKEKSKLDKVKEEVNYISEGVGYAADAISEALSEESWTGQADEKPQDKEKDKSHLQEPQAEQYERSRSASPNLLQPHTPQKHHHHQSGKGWSTMLDDWLCGPTAAHITRSPSPAVPIPTPSSVPEVGSADVARSFSAPATPSPHSDPRSLPASIPIQRSGSGGHLAVFSPPRISHLTSPLAQSPSSIHSTGSISSSSSDGIPIPSYTLPEAASLQTPSLLTSNMGADHASMQIMDKPELVLPPATEESFSGRGGNGCYLHLVKERLMGMYLSVYVYKGCEHLVQGVDKDYVTTGLAGGRLGNKGGIGISLKMADHTFLFVNSHLAAHTGRQSARIANVQKIKSELKLDCFLPPLDMRAKADDITERFDTVFWCGDLNFRLEMTRLHAEWLIEHKSMLRGVHNSHAEYQEALSFDQLKNAMKSSDPNVNPYQGFEEGLIDFPPTFKYDVWRSLKHTNRELRKSIKRKPSDASTRAPKPSAELSASLASSGGFLGNLPEMDGENDYPEDDAASHRSFSSRYSATGPSNAGTDIEEGDSLEMDETAMINGQANSHRPLDVSVKEKAKHLLNMVRSGSNKVLGSSPGRRISLRRKKAESSLSSQPKQSMDYDPDLRRDSTSTQGSAAPSMEALSSSPVDEARIRSSPPMSTASPVIPTSPSLPMQMPRRPSVASSMQPVGRKFSALKRTVSGRSNKVVDEELIDGEMVEDSREGRYDTSKKQRVPSWCDRVLWKVHVIPDVQPIEEDEHSQKSSRPFNRLSHAFADLRDHFRTQMGRTPTIEPPSSSRAGPSSPPSILRPITSPTSPVEIASPTSPSSAQHFIESPPSTTFANGLKVDTSSDGLVPAPKDKPRRLTLDSTSPSQIRHPLLNISGSHSSPPAKPRITFDPASSAAVDRRPSSQDLTITTRRRANSDGHTILSSPTLDKSSETLTNGTSSHPGAYRTASQETALPPPDPGASDSTLSRAKTTDPNVLGSSSERVWDHSHSLDRARTEGFDHHHHPPDRVAEIDESRGAFKRFWRDLPYILSRGSVSVTRDTPEDGAAALGAEKVEEGERRRKKHDRGEVVCLHYGTIDDAGMRQLEGRSPAIFAAAVYI